MVQTTHAGYEDEEDGNLTLEHCHSNIFKAFYPNSSTFHALETKSSRIQVHSRGSRPCGKTAHYQWMHVTAIIDVMWLHRGSWKKPHFLWRCHTVVITCHGKNTGVWSSGTLSGTTTTSSKSRPSKSGTRPMSSAAMMNAFTDCNG